MRRKPDRLSLPWLDDLQKPLCHYCLLIHNNYLSQLEPDASERDDQEALLMPIQYRKHFRLQISRQPIDAEQVIAARRLGGSKNVNAAVFPSGTEMSKVGANGNEPVPERRASFRPPAIHASQYPANIPQNKTSGPVVRPGRFQHEPYETNNLTNSPKIKTFSGQFRSKGETGKVQLATVQPLMTCSSPSAPFFYSLGRSGGMGWPGSVVFV